MSGASLMNDPKFETVPVEPNDAANKLFKGKFNIDPTRKALLALIKICSASKQKINWLKTLYALINTYVTVINVLADQLDAIQHSGINIKAIIPQIDEALRFTDTTTFNTFLDTCEMVILSINTERSEIIAQHINIAYGDSQRYTGIMKVSGKIVLDHKLKTEQFKTDQNAQMTTLSGIIDKLPANEAKTNAKNAALNLNGLSQKEIDLVNRIIGETFENTVLNACRSLSDAQAALSLTLFHLLPNGRDGSNDKGHGRKNSK